ncbi:hypothetical protein JGUZn3_03280 [Entomobacter blattae]|uniref:DUF3560 domain-containing protein n=2 Tax=Entomobacter blattae TaxID=2762277 RepID=A0A7H1NP75_9PROT|nr:hypothetical protein JGUZn3_03280 [Entomobacter blattae]
MNQFALKLESKKNYYRSLAEKATKKAEEIGSLAVQTVTDVLPAGQPILVGHHSEKKHRALIEGVNKKMDQAEQLLDKADYYNQKADSVGKYGGISSDDPLAIEKLKIELSKARFSSDRSRIKKEFPTWRQEKPLKIKKWNLKHSSLNRTGL